MKSKGLLGAFILSVILLATACQGEQSSGEQKEFKVGMEAGYPPFNWTQMDDSNEGVAIEGTEEFAGGYDVEIAKLIAKELDRKLVIVKTKWAGLVPAVQSGKIDAIIGGMSPTAERRKEIDFSDYYYASDLTIVVKKGSPYESAQSLEDFKGAKITGQQSTFHYDVIDQIPGVVKETAQSDFPVMRVALQSGSVDGYVSEKPEALSATKANPDLTYVEFEKGKGFETTPDDTALAVGVKKDSELMEEINKAIEGINEEQRKELMDKAIENQPVEQ